MTEQLNSNLDFGAAVKNLNIGNKVSRIGWNGKGMFLFLISGNAWEFTCDASGVDEIDTLPFICMKTADNKLVPWLASQSDVMANDWMVID